MINASENIGKVVAKNYHAATVFSKYGIDFCCKGNRSIENACQALDLDSNVIINELNHIDNSIHPQEIDYDSLPLDLLIDFIEKKFHRKVRTQTPILINYLQKLYKAHGEKHLELYTIAHLFEASAQALELHMQKEETILFPFIRQMLSNRDTISSIFGKSVENPINMMKEEHEIEGDRFREIAKLSQNYTVPSDACNTYKACYALLKEFESDLHLHIHLENNLLFSKVLALKK